jgi:hypothetical protein
VACKASVFELGASKVDEQADLDPSGFQIVDQLGLMLGSDRLNCLQLDDDFLFDEKICVKGTDDSIAKVNIYRVLALHLKPFSRSAIATAF